MDKHQLATVFPCYAVGNRERVAARTATHTVAINGANANAEHRRSLSWDLFRRDGAPPVRAAEWWLREREREREREKERKAMPRRGDVGSPMPMAVVVCRR